jgi:hypothetical protein
VSTIGPLSTRDDRRLDGQPRAAFLAATSLTFLKSRLKHTLRPLTVANRLRFAAAEATATRSRLDGSGR